MVVLLIIVVVDVDLCVVGELIRFVARDSMREAYHSQQKRLTIFSLWWSCFLNSYVHPRPNPRSGSRESDHPDPSHWPYFRVASV